MLPILEYDLYKYLALAVMLLAILSHIGRDETRFLQAVGRLLDPRSSHCVCDGFTRSKRLRFLIYLGYKFGLFSPNPLGIGFQPSFSSLPFDFAVLNWPFVALYLTCRLWPDFRSARSAMWLSVVAMSLLNVLLFSLASTMVSNVFDAGQGIGVIRGHAHFANHRHDLARPSS